MTARIPRCLPAARSRQREPLPAGRARMAGEETSS